MRFSIKSVLVAILAADAVVASSWFPGGKTAYNKWHETELERWLSDNNVPYPTPADRKDLEDLIKKNWDEKIVTPYNSWDLNQLNKYLAARGEQVKKGAEKNKDSLVSQIKASWTDTSDKTNEAYASTKDWIFDSWTESNLKSFADKHGIPVPQPRTRDSLLKVVRENYQTIANKAGETAAYPGNWLYETWTDSDLKAWCDERGIPVPQPTQRDKLVATVRRNSRIASNNLSSWSSSLSASAAAATESIADSLFDTYSDSQLKKWADGKGLKIPQGSKRNEILAVIRRYRSQINSEAAAASKSAASAYNAGTNSAASAYGAATSSAGNEYAEASADAQLKFANVQSAFYSWLDWAQLQLGYASNTASASGSKASAQAVKSASSASRSASSVYSKASKAAESAASSAKQEL